MRYYINERMNEYAGGGTSFFQGFNFDTLLVLISCIASVVALFLGGAAYKQCQVNNNKTISDDGQDHSQKAGRDIINNASDPTALATLFVDFAIEIKKK